MRNSGKVLLLVLFTGGEAKIILNQGKYTFKQSSVDKRINWFLLTNTILLVVVGAVLAALNYRFVTQHYHTDSYIFDRSMPAAT